MLPAKEKTGPKKGLDEREKAFEAKYQLDEELAFKTAARRSKLLGLWVAARLGLTGDEAAAYARRAVELDLGDPAHDGLLSTLAADLDAAGKPADAAHLGQEFERLAAEARGQIVAEAAAGRLSAPQR